jgi:hypothetical protein
LLLLRLLLLPVLASAAACLAPFFFLTALGWAV